MTFSKDNSIQVKGVAILCMIAFHLWGFPERIPSEAVHPWFGSPITKALQICVPIYLFIAGYGLQCIANKSTITWKGVAERLRKLYVSYWWVTVPFISLGFITGYYAFDIKELLGNLMGLSSSYNGEWWFYSLYVELLIIFYFISRIRLEWKGYLCLMVAILIATRGANSFLALDSSVMYQRHLKMVLIDLNIFMLGCFFSKFDVFQYIQTKYEWLLNRTSGALLCLIVPILVRAYLPLIGITELIFVPIFILGIINIYKWGGGGVFLHFMGRHSMNLWLIHSFFIFYYLNKVTFITNNPLVMLCVVVACSVSCSIAIEKIKKLLSKKV